MFCLEQTHWLKGIANTNSLYAGWSWIDDVDDLVNQLQLDREDNGKLTFDCFIEIFKISSKHAKMSFCDRKK